MDIDVDKAAATPWVASFVGMLMGLRFVPGESWGERLMNGVIMFGTGIIIGGGIAEYLELKRVMTIASVVLTTAAFSIVVFQLGVQALRATSWGKILEERVRKTLNLQPDAKGD